jgi:hypothetical protein
MRPATVLTMALLLVAILGAAVMAFFVHPGSHSNPRCSGAGGQPITCEAPNTTAH